MKTNFKFKAAILLFATFILASSRAGLSQAPCFTDDFEAGHANKWAPLTASRWQVSSEAGSLRYFLNTTDYGSPDDVRLGELALINNLSLGDFIFACVAKSADAAAGNPDANLCIIFGYQDFDSYYYVNYNSTADLTTLHRIHNGVDATIAVYNSPTFNDGLYHALRVERTGSRILAFFDGTQFLEVTDNFFGQGQLGLGSFNDSGYFDDVTISANACAAPAAPQNLQITAVENHVALSWAKNSEPDLLRYRIYRSTSSPAITKIDSISGFFFQPRYTDSSAVLGTTYFYRVTAVDSAMNESAFSNEVSATPRPESFTEVAGGPIGLFAEAVAWGDYDRDGDLDILLTGNANAELVSRVYRNDGGKFVDLCAPLTGVDNSSVAWGDYDGDGDLDILLTGGTVSFGGVTKIYRNDDGDFVDLAASLVPASFGTVAWGDYDNDGDLDVLAGFKIYRNDLGRFVETATVVGNRGAWGDYDNDGDLDIVVTGFSNFNYFSKVYRNDSGAFFDIGAALQGVSGGSVAWGDYDGDGNLDVLLTGTFSGPGINYVTKVYQNDGGSFTDVAAGLPGVDRSAAAWGDYDNDGDLDILLVGQHGGFGFSEIYRNDNGSFVDILAVLTANGPVAWGDYDNDGDLDILAGAKIYRNNVTKANTVPLAPTGLVANITGNSVALSWTQAADGETAQNSLTYNLRLGTTPGGSEVVSPMSEVVAGTRWIPQWGNVNHNTQWTIQRLPRGTYYCSVQAVDNAFAGSAFAPEQSFAVTTMLAPQDLRATAGFQKVTLSWMPNDDPNLLRYRIYGGAAPNPTTKIDSVEGAANATKVISGLTNGTTYYFRLTAVDNAGRESAFSNEVSATPFFEPFTDVFSYPYFEPPCDATWGDYDNDGDLDFLVRLKLFRNDQGSFGGHVVDIPGGACSGVWGDYDNDGDLDILANFTVYRNDNGNFIDLGISLAGSSGFFAWGDYDNDGDLDILVSSKVYRNDPAPSGRNFVDIGATLESAAAWGDYDNDGDLDILAGSKIYRNDSGNFVDLGAPAFLNEFGLRAWGDYDSDGDLDVLALTKIYRNDNGNFVNLGASLLDARAWGDYDNDGDLDVLADRRVYRNDTGNFIDTGASFLGAMSWADYDNDGDLDVLVRDASGLKIYRNNIGKANTKPANPTGLAAAVANNSVTLSWNKAGDNETPQNGLTYQLRLGRTPGGHDIVSPMSDAASGYRRVPQWGNANHNSRWTITRLPKGTYYWSVQAVDHGFAGSGFTPEQSFAIATILAPQDLRATAGFQSVTLAWAPANDPNLRRYRIYAGTSPNPTAKIDSVEGAANATKVISGLANGTTYFFRLTTVDNAGNESALSNEVSATPFHESFTEIPTALPELKHAAAAWGDYDNDGDLDLLLAGITRQFQTLTKVYRNENGNFTDMNAPLAATSGAALVWGDYDNDGDLDILMQGANLITKVYRNDNGNFIDIAASLAGLNVGINTLGQKITNKGTAAWADYDNDGDLDILLTGLSGRSVRTTKLYRNEVRPERGFVEAAVSLAGSEDGSIAFGDCDNDGDLDVLLTDLIISGFLPNNIIFTPVAKLYRNDAGAGFAEISGALPGFGGGAAAFGDFDNDGDLDILAGSKIYRNNNQTFVDLGVSLLSSKGAWGDYDNDGDLDVLAGSQVYRNDGGSFAAISLGLNASAHAVWGDYDNDGDLDILAINPADSRSIPLTPFTKLYRNNVATANASPAAPAGLVSAVAGNSATLSWNPATDGQTPANGLAYNLRVGKTPGGGEVVSPMSKVSSGYRQLPQLGNANQNMRWPIKNMPAGTYYWSVQAVDHGFAGSAFAAEQSFTVTIPIAAPQNLLAVAEQTQIKLAWAANVEGNLLRYRIYRSTASPASVKIDSVAAGLTAYTDANVAGGTTYFYRITAVNQALQESPFSSEVNAQLTTAAFADLTLTLAGDVCAWGDFDSDGDLDILTRTTVYRNDNGNFVDIGAALTGEQAAWGDYDNDGDLDVLSGVKIFRNDNGSFAATNATFGNLSAAAGYWGDYDNDGDLDILFIGTGENFITKIYRNDPTAGERTFVDVAAPFNDVSLGAAAWGDYDNDGDLDVLLAGLCHSGRIAKIYRNEGGTFVDILAPLLGMSAGSVAWGDYDSDGDLDIVLSGSSSNGGNNLVYRNDNGSFVVANRLDNVSHGSVAWGDYDNDGDLDILLAGEIYSNFMFNSVALIYRNDGERFVSSTAGLRGVTNSAVAWGDYDNDGDLDILFSGREWLRDSFNGVSFLGGFLATVYRNNVGAKNTAPVAPANLVATITGRAAALSWSQSTDNQTPQNGLTYNLRLGTAPGGGQVVSPMSEASSGFRRVAQFGNTNHNRSWMIKNLSKGRYYWSAQALDHAFAGSAFAPEQTFVVPDTAWPGDTNNDRLVNQADVLPIGLHFNKTGPKRDNASIFWKPQPAEPWSPPAATYADANGDGRVNQADVLPIGLNWGRTRSQPPLALEETVALASSLPRLGMTITGDTNPGKPFWLDVHADSVKNLFGISFELLYSPAANVHLDSILAGKWLGNDLILFALADTIAGKINLAVSRKAGQGGRDSSGVVARIKMRMSSAAMRGQVTTLTLQDVAANDPAGNPIQFNVINGSIVTSVVSRPQAYVPQRFALYPNVPNPFNPSTMIQYDLPQAVDITLEIFDMLGRRVRTLVNQHQQAGRYSAVWDGRNDNGQTVSSGVFIYQLYAGKFVQSRRMVLVR
jgi:fibronectin type 3 domain-containing protein